MTGNLISFITRFLSSLLCVNRLLLWLLPLPFEAVPTCPGRHFTWDDPAPGARRFLSPSLLSSLLPLLLDLAVNCYTYLKHMAATPVTEKQEAESSIKETERRKGEQLQCAAESQIKNAVDKRSSWSIYCSYLLLKVNFSDTERLKILCQLSG